MKRSFGSITRILTYVTLVVCLALLAWACLEAAYRPCRRLATGPIGLGGDCPSIVEEAITLVVVLGLLLAGVWALHLRTLPTSFLFLYMSGTLAIGLVSAGGNYQGMRLFSVAMAWAPVVVVFSHRRLLEATQSRRGAILLAGMALVAAAYGLPPIILSYERLHTLSWFDYWVYGLYLGPLIAYLYVVLRFAWHARQGDEHVRARAARLMAFGNLASVLPLALLSVVPAMLDMITTLEWELAFPGLLLSPLLYIIALRPSLRIGRSGAMKRLSLVYVVTIVYAFYASLAIELVYRMHLDLFLDWPYLAAIIMVLSVTAMLPTHQYLERLIDWIWLGSHEGRATLIAETAASLGDDTSNEQLQRTLVDTLRRSLGLVGAAMFLADSEGDLHLTVDSNLSIESGDLHMTDSALLRYLAEKHVPLSHRQVCSALDGSYVDASGRSLLSRRDLAVWVPMINGHSLSGLLLAGHKEGGDYFTREDYAVLNVLANQARLAIRSMRLAGEKAQVEKQLSHAQRMEAVGRLAGGVAHDFNNLLTIINGYSEILLETTGPEEEGHNELEQIHKAGERAAGLTRQLLAFSRQQSVEPQVFSINTLLVDLGKMLSRLIGEDIELVLQLSAQVGDILADPGQVEQIVMNLAVNARDAMPKGGKLTIETASTASLPATARFGADMAPGPYVMMAVSDTGMGMSDQVQQHVFEPFFTTKETDQGTGLGLAIVWGNVRENGGAVAFESEESIGTRFAIYFPRCQDAPSSAHDARGRRSGGQETILLVEDQEPVRMLTARLLRKLGYRVLTANDGQDALDRYQAQVDQIDLLLTDMVMPEMGGIELSDALHNQRPDMHVLFMTGHSEHAAAVDTWTERSGGLLHKPFTAAALAETVRTALDE